MTDCENIVQSLRQFCEQTLDQYKTDYFNSNKSITKLEYYKSNLNSFYRAIILEAQRISENMLSSNLDVTALRKEMQAICEEMAQEFKNGFSPI